MKHLIKGVMLGCLVTVLLSALSLQQAKANVPLSGNGCTGCASLNGVAVVSTNDVWAVGSYTTKKAALPYRTLTEHWNGTTWSKVKSPYSGSLNNELVGVAAVSANDVWAVGSYINIGDTTGGTLTEHWNGTTWSIVKTPSSKLFTSSLVSVAVVSTNDVWAVGVDNNGTLIEHWNGAQWSIVPSPSLGPYGSSLNGVAAVSANDVWAVGSYDDSNYKAYSLTEQWNGTKWSVVPSPNPGPSYNTLSSVTSVSANDVWAVDHHDDSNYNEDTLIEQWNGTKWSVVPSPNPGPNTNGLSAIAAVSANNVWTVGTYANSNNYQDTLTEQWNGTKWLVVPSPSPGLYGSELNGVAVVSAKDVWTVGGNNNTKGVTLIEHWNGTQWSVVPSPNLVSG